MGRRQQGASDRKLGEIRERGQAAEEAIKAALAIALWGGKEAKAICMKYEMVEKERHASLYTTSERPESPAS